MQKTGLTLALLPNNISHFLILTKIKKIVIITSGQPSLNPRLVKEADALAEAGYQVTVIYQFWNNWGTALDKNLLSNKKWDYALVGGDPLKKKFTYWKSRIQNKIGQIIARHLGFSNNLAELAIGRCTLQLAKMAKSIPADLYIAHNLGALPAAVKAAKRYRKPCGFDAEDFHRNEVSNDLLHFDVMLKKHIEDKYIPQVNYLTASSPQIANSYHKLFPTKEPITILNVFNKQEDITTKDINQNPRLKLFWFSQTIGTNRGIENIITALNNLKSNAFELHLLGSLQHGINKEYFEKLIDDKLYTLHFHGPIAPDKLIIFASKFDIGLALEPAFSINNDIALSNKIFTYVQAGLAIIASNTTAQQEFMLQYLGMGQIYRQKDLSSLETILRMYSDNRSLLNQHQKQAAIYATETLNWETEKEKFLALVKKTLN
jgi:glycosyltransferase involved in cell wall biosynthesis